MSNDELQRHQLLDFDVLRSKLETGDFTSLIAEYGLFLKNGDDQPIRLIHSALTMSETILTTDKSQLADQLCGRLWIWRELPEIDTL